MNLFSLLSKKALPLCSTSEFRAQYFPDVSDELWNDWRWQMANRLQSREEIERLFDLSKEESDALEKASERLPIAITPYYASLMDLKNPNDPLRRTHIPTLDELSTHDGEYADPLGEEPVRTKSCIIHRYPDRLVFFVSNTCAGYCRYCNRARTVGKKDEGISSSDWQEGFDYISAHKEVRDVLISGGDPLLLSDEKLNFLLNKLYSIPHVEFVRIGSKLPVTLPQRITPELVGILKKHRPLWISLHTVHPNEVTEDSSRALAMLVDAGIVIGSQTVLLKGVNDDPVTMTKLMHALLKNRVTPYALFQFDQIKGAGHFRTTVDKGLEIINALRGHTSGYAVPAYIIDPPDGGGKAQLCPDPIVGREGDYLILRNYEGKIYRYYDPASSD